jgi:predicted ATPase
MKIYYLGHGRQGKPSGNEQNYIALYWDRWDDFGTKTQFPAEIVFDGVPIHLPYFNIKILIEGTSFSGDYLDAKRNDGWNGEFPIPSERYVSVPSDIEFYPILIAKLGEKGASKVLTALHDAGYLQNIVGDQSILAVINSSRFNESLLRESGAVKAFADGWRAFVKGQASTVNDFSLHLLSARDSTWTLDFRFNSQLLPYDINVIVGPNGIGKSYCLKSFVEYWLKIGRGAPNVLNAIGHVPFDSYPNLQRLILVSYSPFEEFEVDLSQSGLQDQDAYKYFGFRRRDIDADGTSHIRISRNLPASDAASSIIECLVEDQSLGFIIDRKNKINTATEVLTEAIKFDHMALALNPAQVATEVFSNMPAQAFMSHVFFSEGRPYIKISDQVLETCSSEELRNLVDPTAGVLFFRDGNAVELSSGQRLFSYIVLNLVGAIRNNSMVVIDEPELFLHPTLEIVLIQLLKDVLVRYASKAIIATHSLVTVREVPANCVHVLRRIDGQTEAVRPPFETFGGDIQRISSYVFGDRSVSKPFESWLAEKTQQFGTAEAFLNALGSEVNEEMIMRIQLNARRS